MTVDEALKKAKRFERRWLQHLALTLRNNRRYILQMQRDQLLAGQDNLGNPLRPTYQNDPFFKSEAKMEAWVRVKKKRASYHEGLKTLNLGVKSPDTPNLIYTRHGKGKFQGKLRADITATDLKIYSTWSRGKNVENKYPTALGLQQKAFNIVWENVAKREIIDLWYNMK